MNKDFSVVIFILNLTKMLNNDLIYIKAFTAASNNKGTSFHHLNKPWCSCQKPSCLEPDGSPSTDGMWNSNDFLPSNGKDPNAFRLPTTVSKCYSAVS